MDTQDKFPPRRDQDEVNRDADFNPEAIAANPGLEDELGEDGLTGAYGEDSEAENAKPMLNRWLVFGLVAGGLAVAAGVAGVAYWRMQQRPARLADTVSLPKVDLGKAHPRRLAQMAGRRIQQMPVRQIQKRVAERVTHLFG